MVRVDQVGLVDPYKIPFMLICVDFYSIQFSEEAVDIRSRMDKYVPSAALQIYNF